MTENFAVEVATERPVQEPTPRRGEPKRITRRRLILRRFLRNKGAVLGLVVITALVVIALIGPYLSQWAYDEVDRRAYLKPPSERHPLGSTQSGRDMLALTLRGLRKSLLIGFLVALLSTGIAAIVGSFAAYFGGWFERIALWVIDLLLVVPSFLLIAVLSTGGPKGPYAWLLLVALLAGFGWMLSSRVVRSLTLSVKEREYVQAARFMGLSAPKTIVRHILPNISSLLIIDATLNVSAAILAETGLSFFGFGVQPPDTSLGTLLGEGARQVNSFPWLFVSPAVAVVVLVLSVNAVGDGLRDALDPNSASGGTAR
ncbi:ABC transporter permease [Microlunatus lacustris]